MGTTKVFVTARSWTHRRESEGKEEHDFNNLLLEFRFAVQRQDSVFVDYCERELERMYRARRPRGGRR